jgi:hypothetical protein
MSFVRAYDVLFVCTISGLLRLLFGAVTGRYLNRESPLDPARFVRGGDGI